MKRLVCLCVCLVCLCLTLPALAVQPKPIETVPVEEQFASSTQHHYLLLCQDTWKDNETRLGNTDGIVLVTLDTRAHRVMLTSLIRDALVVRPDGDIGRVNYIAKNYSPEALCEVLSAHFGVRIEKYILFNFSHVQTIIDALGGVDITIDSSEASYLMRYAISKTSTTPTVTGKGTYRFGGHAAVIYMRIRKASSGGDFMRTQRVRTVLSTLADQCRNISLEEARALVDVVIANNSRTNMSLDDMLTAMGYAFDLRGCTVEELRVPHDDDVKPITYAGMMVQELDWVSSRERISEYMQNSLLIVDDEEDELEMHVERIDE